MKKAINPELIRIRARIVSGMISYLDSDPSYTDEDVERCEHMLNEFAEALTDCPDDGRDSYIMAKVKDTVLRLNRLNESSGGSLIETDQREDICEFIITASRSVGLQSDLYDITEKWRQW